MCSCQSKLSVQGMAPTWAPNFSEICKKRGDETRNWCVFVHVVDQVQTKNQHLWSMQILLKCQCLEHKLAIGENIIPINPHLKSFFRQFFFLIRYRYSGLRNWCIFKHILPIKSKLKRQQHLVCQYLSRTHRWAVNWNLPRKQHFKTPFPLRFPYIYTGAEPGWWFFHY